MTLEVVSPDHMVEFPRVHPKFQGRPSQFGYAGQFVTDSGRGLPYGGGAEMPTALLPPPPTD